MVKVPQEPSTSWLPSWNVQTTICYGVSFPCIVMTPVLTQLPHRLAILGLTFQYTTSRISRVEYDKFHSIYHDEVARLNPPPPASFANDYDFKAQNPDDRSLYTVDELRFMMFRHWNLYDAMYHSSYVAGKLGIWKEKGRKRLTGLLAKMG